MFQVIEEALQGCEVDRTIEVQIEPDQGFGEYNAQRVFLEPRAIFPAELEEGALLEGSALPAGCTADITQGAFYTVTDIYPEHLVLDGNHPLAGIALRLRLNVGHVREASTAEIDRGTVGGYSFFCA